MHFWIYMLLAVILEVSLLSWLANRDNEDGMVVLTLFLCLLFSVGDVAVVIFWVIRNW